MKKTYNMFGYYYKLLKVWYIIMNLLKLLKLIESISFISHEIFN